MSCCGAGEPGIRNEALVADDDDWERVPLLHTESLLADGSGFLRRLSRDDGVHGKQLLAHLRVLFTHCPGRLTVSRRNLPVWRCSAVRGMWPHHRRHTAFCKCPSGKHRNKAFQYLIPLTSNSRGAPVVKVILEELDATCRFIDALAGIRAKGEIEVDLSTSADGDDTPSGSTSSQNVD